MSDQLTRHRAQLWLTRAVGIAAVLAAACFALAPLSTPPITPWGPTSSATNTAPPRAPLDLAPFGTAQLFPLGQETQGASDTATASSPSDLALIAIMRDGASRTAAIFSARENRLHVAGVGDVIAGVTVRGIDDGGVELHHGGGVSRLDLVRAMPAGGS